MLGLMDSQFTNHFYNMKMSNRRLLGRRQCRVLEPTSSHLYTKSTATHRVIHLEEELRTMCKHYAQ